MKTIWEKYSDRTALFAFCEDYKKFMDSSKTEREAVDTTIELAKAKGFVELSSVNTLKPGDKVYTAGHGKTIALFVIGTSTEGMNILGSHIDSPRIDLKQNPLYETDGLALFDTHYYGGIKKYQWVATPLALHGVVCKKDGSTVKVAIGDKESDPVIGISDLLPHLGKDQMAKPASNVIEGEDLNALVGTIPSSDEKDPVKANILALLKEKYDIEEKDFISAELEIVPAGNARDYGLDGSMVMCYGQDDRVCAYTSLRALLDLETPEKTACVLLTDKEEVGSNGNSGAHSYFFENATMEVLEKCGISGMLNFRRYLAKSKCLSNDVAIAYDPNFASVYEKKNSAFFGKGPVFEKYTGGRGKSGCTDTNPEFIAEIRAIMEGDDIYYQTAELGKVDQGGGGTIAYILANKDIQVMDSGVAVQNMHALYEVTSKADIYESYVAYNAFLRKMK